MPIDTRHAEYGTALPLWERCRDVLAGQDAVKVKTTKYLPLLEGQQSEMDPAYSAYLKRAMFFPAMERTVAGLIGMVLRKPPVVTAPPAVEKYLDDLMLTQDSFQGALALILQEILTLGRFGIFADWSEKEQRPYWSAYPAEAIVNWREQKVAGVRRTTMLVLEEREPLPGNDPFQAETRVKYRELRVEPEGVVVREWTRQSAGGRAEEWVAGPPALMKRRNAPLQTIPFVCFGPRTVGMAVAKPPMLDLADINLSHYRTAADLEHGRHFTALPTPWVTGWAGNADGTPLKIGSGTAWIIPEVQAKVGMLEFTGQGLESLRRALEDKERLMAVVGTRLLEEQPRAAETAEAVRLRQAGEHSALATLVTAASTGLSLALQWFAFWLGASEVGDPTKVSVELSRDFVSTRMTPQEAQALVQLWQAQGISYETLYWNLQQGEWARPDVEWEDELQKIGEDDALMPEKPEPEPPVAPPPPEQQRGAPAPEAFA